MIYDQLKNIDAVCGPGTRLYQGLILARDIGASPPDGRIEADGDRIYALVSTYSTLPRDERRFEAHRKYIDIQVVLEGVEVIDVALGAAPSATEKYDETKDVAFYAAPPDCASLVMRPGRFAVFNPGDLHRPGVSLDESRSVRKLVVKVLVESSRR